MTLLSSSVATRMCGSNNKKPRAEWFRKPRIGWKYLPWNEGKWSRLKLTLTQRQRILAPGGTLGLKVLLLQMRKLRHTDTWLLSCALSVGRGVFMPPRTSWFSKRFNVIRWFICVRTASYLKIGCMPVTATLWCSPPPTPGWGCKGEEMEKHLFLNV